MKKFSPNTDKFAGIVSQLNGRPLGHLSDALSHAKKDCKENGVKDMQEYLAILSFYVTKAKLRPIFSNYVLDETLDRMIRCFESKFYGKKTFLEKLFGDKNTCDDWFPEVKP